MADEASASTGVEQTRDYHAYPEVADYANSFLQAVEEGVVDKPPLLPFRETRGMAARTDLEAGAPLSWLQWRRDEGMKPTREGDALKQWRTLEAGIW